MCGRTEPGAVLGARTGTGSCGSPRPIPRPIPHQTTAPDHRTRPPHRIVRMAAPDPALDHRVTARPPEARINFPGACEARGYGTGVTRVVMFIRATDVDPRDCRCPSSVRAGRETLGQRGEHMAPRRSTRPAGMCPATRPSRSTTTQPSPCAPLDIIEPVCAARRCATPRSLPLPPALPRVARRSPARFPPPLPAPLRAAPPRR